MVTAQADSPAAQDDIMRAGTLAREIFSDVANKWALLIIETLGDETRRFSELRRLIDGVSERMLAQTLQWLEADGLVKRVAYEVVPPHVEYSLTPLGQQAAHKVRALADWIESSIPAVVQHWTNSPAAQPQSTA